MSTAGCDLVRDSEIKVKIFGDQTIQYVRNPLSRERRAMVEETWQRVKELGRGGYGVVWLERCTSASTSRVRAVKELRAGGSDVSSITCFRELEAVAKFSHERYRDCFVQSYGWYETDQAVFITMEYLEHGDLQQYIHNDRLTEYETRVISNQLLEGLDFMHSHNFVHRDIKPGNILVQQRGPQWWVKIADFGISKRIESTAARTLIGTQGYTAPEVMGIRPLSDLSAINSHDYSPAVDIWAVGIIAFRILTARPAFETPADLFNYVTQGASFPKDMTCLASMSSECISFIRTAIAPSASRRPTAKDALLCSWIQTSGEEPPAVLARQRDQSMSCEKASMIPTPSAAWSTSSSVDKTLPFPAADWSTSMNETTAVPFDRLTNTIQFPDIPIKAPTSTVSAAIAPPTWLLVPGWVERYKLLQQIRHPYVENMLFAPKEPNGYKRLAINCDTGLILWEAQAKQQNLKRRGKLPYDQDTVASSGTTRLGGSCPVFSQDGKHLAVSFPAFHRITVFEANYGHYEYGQDIHFQDGAFALELSFKVTVSSTFIIVAASDYTIRVYERTGDKYVNTQILEAGGDRVITPVFAIACPNVSHTFYATQFVSLSGSVIRVWGLQDNHRFKQIEEIDLEENAETGCIAMGYPHLEDSIVCVVGRKVFYLLPGSGYYIKNIGRFQDALESLHCISPQRALALSGGKIFSLSNEPYGQSIEPRPLDIGFAVSSVAIEPQRGAMLALYNESRGEIYIYIRE